MFANCIDPHRVSSILERFNHHLAAFLGCSPGGVEDLAGQVCDLVSNVLQYRTVLLRMDDGNGLRCDVEKDRRGEAAAPDTGYDPLLELVRDTVREPVVLDVAGCRALAAGIPLPGPGRRRCLGHMVALRPYGIHDPDVDLPLMGMLASLLGTAVRGWADRKRYAGIRHRLLSEIRISRKRCEFLRRSGEAWRVMADNVHDWEMWLAPDGSVLGASPSCERVCGHPPESFRQDPSLLEAVIHPDDLEQWRRSMVDGTMLHCPCAEFRIVHRDGFERWVSQSTVRVRSDAGRDLGLRLSIRDISEQKYAEALLQAEALRDHSTGLPGQVLLLDRVVQALERSRRRDGYTLALVCVRLDRFSFFSRCCGEDKEDRLRSAIASRLGGCVRRLDTVSCLEGDEFAVFLEGLSAPREAVQVCRRIRTSLDRPFQVDGCELNLRASLGVAIDRRGQENPGTLFGRAQLAMRQAERTGRYRFKIYTPRLGAPRRPRPDREPSRAAAGESLCME